MATERNRPIGENDPTLSFVRTGRTSVREMLRIGTSYPVVAEIDRALEARSQGDDAGYQAHMAEVANIGKMSVKIGMHEFVFDQVNAALLAVPEGVENRGAEVAKAILAAAPGAEARAQEIRDELVAEGKMSDKVDQMVGGWVEVEMLRMAAQAREAGNLKGPRPEVMEALNPVSGQIDTSDWTNNDWARVVHNARAVADYQAEEAENVGRQSGATTESRQADEPDDEPKIWKVAKQMAGGVSPAVLGALVYDEAKEVVGHFLDTWKEQHAAEVHAKAAAHHEKAARHMANAEAIAKGEKPPHEEVTQPVRVAEKAEKQAETDPVLAEILKRQVANEERLTKVVENHDQRLEQAEENIKLLTKVSEKLGGLITGLVELNGGKGSVELQKYKDFQKILERDRNCVGCGAARELGHSCAFCGNPSEVANYLNNEDPLMKDVLGMKDMVPAAKVTDAGVLEKDRNWKDVDPAQVTRVPGGSTNANGEPVPVAHPAPRAAVGPDGAPLSYETDKPAEGIFTKAFLRRHGLPDNFKIISSAGNLPVTYDIDVAGQLEFMRATSANSDYLNSFQFRNACEGTEKASGPENARAFAWGIAPLIRLIYGNNVGTYASLVGGDNAPGLLDQYGFSLRGVANAFKDDEVAKRALGIFLQMDSRTHNTAENRNPGKKEIWVPNLRDEDRDFAAKLEKDFKDKMATSHLSWTHRDAMFWMIETAQKTQEYLSSQGVDCDRATTELMMQLSTLLNGGPGMLDNRAVENKSYAGILHGDPYERATRSFLAKIFIRKREREDLRAEPGEQKFLFLAEAVNKGGVDGLFDTMWRMDEVRYKQAMKGAVALKNEVDAVELIMKGEGEGRAAKNAQDLRKMMLAHLQKLREPEVPVITNETAQAFMDTPLPMEQQEMPTLARISTVRNAQEALYEGTDLMTGGVFGRLLKWNQAAGDRLAGRNQPKRLSESERRRMDEEDEEKKRKLPKY